MNKIGYFIASLTLILVSCGVESNRFKVEGRFLNLNQGEFYVYSIDNLIDGIDTIKVQGGRFAYDMQCERPGTLVLVFPNFSEQPLFAEPGEKVEVRGDASHLKEMTVKGTDDNELMNKFRESVVSASPPEVMRLAGMFIKDHPASPVSAYLLRKYFITTSRADYKQAYQLVQLLLKEQPRNGMLVQMKNKLEGLVQTTPNVPLPKFSAVGVNGEKVSQDILNKAQVGVLSVWSTDNSESMNIQSMLKTKLRSAGGKLKIVSICMDPGKTSCKETLRRDSISWPNICDERMFEGAVAKKLGVYSIPYNIVLKNGKIVDRNLNSEQLRKKLESML